MKPLLLIAVAAASAGACSLSSSDAPPSAISFELRNDSSSTVYLFQSCLVDLTITSLADPVHVVERESPCGCDCGESCPVCGPCFEGSREFGSGFVSFEYWRAVSVTTESAPTGSCERKRPLPAGPYRIDVPVYATADDAAARTGARIATQTFALPPPDEVVSIALGVWP